MEKSCGCSHSKCNKTPKGKMCPKHGMEDCSMKEEKDPEGPVKPYKSPEEIAKKHKVSLDKIMKQVKVGTKVEGEHTTSKSGARITALQHIEELPDYYTRLKKAEQVKEGNLHQWFKGSRSKDGKPGWVNVVTGGTCASDEPGEGTPKCVSSSKRASMTKSERLSASRRKKSADPGQQSKSGAAKPTYVSTDVKEDWSDKYKRSIDCDNPKGFSQRAHCQGRKKMQEQSFTIDVAGHKSAQKQQKIRNLATGTTNPNEKAAAQRKLSGPSLPLADEYVIGESDKEGKGSGKKDACYKKVKSRYSVWPSAYASGALVKCRKAGASNWGNKSEHFFPEDHKEIASGKKVDDEGYMVNLELDQMERSIEMLRRVIKNPKMQLPAWVQSKITRAADFVDTAAEYMSSDEEVSEACWVGYKQLGMKKKGKKMVPNCVKENIDKIQQYGRTYTIILTWHGSTYNLQTFFPTSTTPSRKDVEDAIRKVYPGAVLNAYMPSRIDTTKPTLVTSEEIDIKEAVLGRYEDFAEQALAIVLDPDKEKRRKNYLLNIGVIGEELQGKAREKGEQLLKKTEGKPNQFRKNSKIKWLLGKSQSHPSHEYGTISRSASEKGQSRAPKQVHAQKGQTKKQGVKTFGGGGGNVGSYGMPQKDTLPRGKGSKAARRAENLKKEEFTTEDWQSANRKDGVDGLSQSTVNKYRRENPGSKLQTAVTEKNPTGKRASRRKSFCARMGGMKKRLTSAETARDPDSRINKALRRWNCN